MLGELKEYVAVYGVYLNGRIQSNLEHVIQADSLRNAEEIAEGMGNTLSRLHSRKGEERWFCLEDLYEA